MGTATACLCIGITEIGKRREREPEMVLYRISLNSKLNMTSCSPHKERLFFVSLSSVHSKTACIPHLHNNNPRMRRPPDQEDKNSIDARCRLLVEHLSACHKNTRHKASQSHYSTEKNEISVPLQWFLFRHRIVGRIRTEISRV